MNFIKKIFSNQIDEEVHKQFIRFGKGTYENKALIEVNKGKSLKIKTSFEFVNEFVRFLAGTIEEKTNIIGVISGAKDLRGEIQFEYQDFKQAIGVKKIVLDNELSKDQIVPLMEKNPTTFFLLSFKTDYGELKSKTNPPKSGKSSEKEPKADFCTFQTNNLDFAKEFVFEKEDFKKAKIKHTYIIDELVIPLECKDDFKKARELAKRKGKIIRELDIDGEIIKKEVEIEV